MKSPLAGMLLVCILLHGCAIALPTPTQTHDPGDLQSAGWVGHYPAWVLRVLAWLSGHSDQLRIEQGIDLYRVRYWTRDDQNRPIPASGLVAFPADGPPKAVVSYQHGTIAKRDKAPSSPGLNEGFLAAMVFSSRGYLLLAPDYPGLGDGPGEHPYLVADITAHAVLDLIPTARRIAKARHDPAPQDLFLAGASQGGHATLASQRAFERAPLPGLHLRASASLSGPYALAKISVPYALQGRAETSSLFLAYQATAYARVYEHPLDSLIRPSWAARLPELFNGQHSTDDIIEILPRNPRDLFQQDFLRDFDAGRPTWFGNALERNSVYDWSPKAPIHLYYGNADRVVSPHEAPFAAQALRARGGKVAVIDVGPYDHLNAILAAIPRAIEWFEGFGPGKNRLEP